jgi:hypothetical protein
MMSGMLERVAEIAWLRPGGAAVTSYLKRWSVDAAIAGFPKTGTTWYSALLRHLLIQRYALSATLMNRLFVSDLGPLPLAFRLPRDIPRLYQSHFMPYWDRPDLARTRASIAPFAAKPMVILIRECKDALVSNYMWTAHDPDAGGFSGGIDEFVLGGQYGIERYVDYYNLLSEARRASGAPTIVTRYEELWHDTAAVLARDAAFLGITGVTPEMLAHAVDRSTFSNMRRIELSEQTNAVIPGLGRPGATRPESLHVRKGGIGNWRDELTPATAARIDAYLDAKLDPMFRPRDLAAAAIERNA